MIRAAIFDLDGTLTDTLLSIKASGDEMLKVFGYPPCTAEQYRIFVGNGADRLVARLLEVNGGQRHYSEACHIYRAVFAEHCMDEVRPYEGIREMLDLLRNSGIKLAVFSNKPDAEAKRVVESTFGKTCFDAVRGQTEGMPLKPDPAGAAAILRELGVSPAETVYLGDTGTDMRTGKALGAFTVGVEWGFRDRAELLENGADRLAASPGEVAEILCDRRN